MNTPFHCTVHCRYLHYGACIALRDRIFSGYLGVAMSGHNNCHALLSCACVHTTLMKVFSLLYWCTEANYLHVMHGSTLSSIRCIGVITLIIHIFVVQTVGESIPYSIIQYKGMAHSQMPNRTILLLVTTGRQIPWGHLSLQHLVNWTAAGGWNFHEITICH